MALTEKLLKSRLTVPKHNPALSAPQVFGLHKERSDGTQHMQPLFRGSWNPGSGNFLGLHITSVASYPGGIVSESILISGPLNQNLAGLLEILKLVCLLFTFLASSTRGKWICQSGIQP